MEGKVYECDKCNKKTDAVRTKQIRKLPNYLIIKINRFKMDKKYNMIKI